MGKEKENSRGVAVGWSAEKIEDLQTSPLAPAGADHRSGPRDLPAWAIRQIFLSEAKLWTLKPPQQQTQQEPVGIRLHQS